MSTRPSPAWPAEVALGALTVVTTVTFWRLFVGTEFVLPLVAAGVLAHALCWWMRRVGLSLVLAVPLWALSVMLFVTDVWYRDSSRFFLPTRETWQLAQTDLSAMGRSFGTAVAPVPSTTGYLVVAAIGLWLVAFAADTLAFRALGGVEAVLPSGVGFVMASALGDGKRMLLATGLWAAAAMMAVALLRAQRARAAGVWLTGRHDTTVANAARWAAAIGVSALVVGAVAGPRLPGSEAEALIDTHSAGDDGSRVTVSPLVDIKSRLSSRSSTVAFRVRTERASYLRLSALDTFDGQRWTPSFDYEDLPSELEPAIDETVTERVVATITIDKLGRAYVPAAFSPVAVQATRGVQWDPDLQTIVVNKGEVRAGEQFTITSAVPDKDKLTAQMLDAPAAAVPEEVVARYTALPDRTKRRVLPEAIPVVAAAGALTPFEKAIALQNWFRTTFTYSLEVPSGSGTSAIDTFLTARQGYCEQFAGTMAAMARALGIPARVAVGFTYGTKQADGSYVVEGKHAHAWPELYLGGVGWVPFEPTPGRGNPDAEQYTGVLTQQEGELPVEVAPSVTTTIATPSPDLSLPELPDLEQPIPETPIAPTGGGGGGGVPTWLVAVALAAVIGGGLVAAWIALVTALYRRRWHRRYAAAASPGDRVVVRWHHTLDELRQAGFRYRPQDTPTEVARRLRDTVSLRDAGLDRMARHVTVAAYASSDPADDVTADVDAIHREIAHRAARVGTRRERLLRRMDPRRLWRTLPGETRAGRRRRGPS